MESFLSQITLYFNAHPKAVIANALRYIYKLDDMLYILYCYHFNLKDPFVDKEIYYQGLKRQGIKHISNTLYTIYTLLDNEENKTLAALVMSDYQIS